MDGDSEADINQELVEYLVTTRRRELEQVLSTGYKDVWQSVVIHGQDLLNVSDLLFSQAMSQPGVYFPRMDRLLCEAVGRVYREGGGEHRRDWQMKELLHLRVSSLPAVPYFHTKAVPRSDNVGQVLQFTGTVTKTAQRRMLLWQKQLTCSKCLHSFPLTADYDQFYEFSPPRLCPSDNSCSGTLFREGSDARKTLDCRDYQEVKVQEQVNHLALGCVPRSIWVTLEDDLVDTVKPGDDVEVIGVVRRRWRAMGGGPEERTEIELALQGLNVRVINSRSVNLVLADEAEAEFNGFWTRPGCRDLAGRDQILSYFCPQVYGLYLVKLALSVVLAGGVERIDESGSRVRGEPHLLLVGDPGTGKSQLLKYACGLSPRSVLTTGVGSTSAGLTVSASRQGGEWHLEAGALVLADGGVCCIDEFNSIREADRTCIHEAMEQQSLSVAKAGMVCQLQTRCKVLAATNPKGPYDHSLSLSLNTSIASPLLSRFDLVLTLLDTHNPAWDTMVSSHLLNGVDPASGQSNTPTQCWSRDKLQSYFSHIQKYKPSLGEAASKVLTHYYRRQRQTDGAEQARTTVRLLQSCVRLAQGHARLMCRDQVTLQDAVMSVLLLESSTDSTASLVHHGNPLHSSFPADPVQEYKTHCKTLLECLDLDHLWPEEKTRLEKLNMNSGVQQQEPSSVKVVQQDYTRVLNRIQHATAVPLPQVQVRGRNKKKRTRSVSEDIGDGFHGDESSGIGKENAVVATTAHKGEIEGSNTSITAPQLEEEEILATDGDTSIRSFASDNSEKEGTKCKNKRVETDLCPKNQPCSIAQSTMNKLSAFKVREVDKILTTQNENKSNSMKDKKDTTNSNIKIAKPDLLSFVCKLKQKSKVTDVVEEMDQELYLEDDSDLDLV